MRLLLVAPLLVGCTAAEPLPCELPGDRDCSDLAPGDGDGKGDGFDYDNSPERMSQMIEYRLSALPRKGRLDTPLWRERYPDAIGPVAWADSLWPTLAGSHNARWLGDLVLSPIEKYDAAFNDAPGCARQPPALFGPEATTAAWTAYSECAGPATRWQAFRHQRADHLHDGLDNDQDGVIDDFGVDGTVDGVAFEWDTSHAWAPASLLEPEPQHAVTVNGVTFEVSDIKALVQNRYDHTAAVSVGGRCNGEPTDPAMDASCRDLNPGTLHVVVTNFLGIAKLPLVMDRARGVELRTRPIIGYEITAQAPVTAAVANRCVGAEGTSWTFNARAVKLVEVRMTVLTLGEGLASRQPLASADFEVELPYHYILELNEDGKVRGGRYCLDSATDHPDFAWSPTDRPLSSNPGVDEADVDLLVRLSIER